MLQLLRIENLALMDAVSLEFSSGYTVVTGETGAGKSILLGALALLSGARADKTLIRQGADACLVEASLLIPVHAPLNKCLEKMGLPPCEEEQLVLRRIFSNSKPSRILVNGGLTTLSQLQEIGTHWIDFHGPGEPQKLFHEKEQLSLLDLFAGLKDRKAAYRSDYKLWRNKLEELQKIQNETRVSTEEAAFLKSQLQEIDSLKPTEESIQQLERDFNLISGAQELRHLCAQLDEGFLGGKGICNSLQSLLPLVHKLADLDSSAQALVDRVESLAIEAADLSGEWRALAHEADFDPVRIKQVESDMDTWMSLRRRFGPTVEGILAKREEIERKLSLKDNFEGTIERLLTEADAMEADLKKVALGLRKERSKAAAKLARDSGKLLEGLGFKKPKLGIEILPRDQLGPDGDCHCRMTFSPNPGTESLPLNKIASSGEMARVMLSLKSVLASVDATPVLVFDEVDSNIGGEVAASVARLLAKLGERHQVFCITHLPQVASVAVNHYVVRKDQSDESTSVAIEDIGSDREMRLDELARMLGDRGSDSARKHASAMLSGSA